MSSSLIARPVQENLVHSNGLPVGSIQSYFQPPLLENWASFNFNKFLEEIKVTPPPRPRGLGFFKLN